VEKHSGTSIKCKVATKPLSAEEFLRRLLLHVVPPHFVRIRHFGLLANRTRQAKLTRCRQLLAVATATGLAALPAKNTPPTSAGPDPLVSGLCPACLVIASLAPQHGIPP
jgi:Putative transposase